MVSESCFQELFSWRPARFPNWRPALRSALIANSLGLAGHVLVGKERVPLKRSDLKLPLFTVSPKTYLLGDDSIAAAHLTDEIAKGRNHSIFWTAPVPELCAVAKDLKFAIPTGAARRSHRRWKGNGLTPLESLKSAGVRAVFLNHTAHPWPLTSWRQRLIALVSLRF